MLVKFFLLMCSNISCFTCQTLEAQKELEETLGKSVQPDYDISELENELEDILSQNDEEPPATPSKQVVRKPEDVGPISECRLSVIFHCLKYCS